MKNYKFYYLQKLIFETDAETHTDAVTNAREVIDSIAPSANPYLNTCGITIKVTPVADDI